jgi:hypothetical protein
MKKLILPFFVLACLGSNAQLRGFVKDKVNDKLKNKSTPTNTTNSTTTETNTNSNANSNTTTTTTTTTSGENTTTDKNAGNQNTNTQANPYANYNPYASGSSKDIRPKYDFQQNVLMEMKSYDKKGNLEADKTNQMRWQFSTEPYMGMEMADKKTGKAQFMITETDKKQMVMLMENDGKKIAMVRKTDDVKAQANKGGSGDDKSKTSFTKTGRSKKICGYNCEEWTSTDEKGNKNEMWFSNEVSLDITKMYAAWGQNSREKNYFANSGNYPTGFMMEMTNYDTNGEKFTMTALEVNLTASKTIETAGYSVF